MPRVVWQGDWYDGEFRIVDGGVMCAVLHLEKASYRDAMGQQVWKDITAMGLLAEAVKTIAKQADETNRLKEAIPKEDITDGSQDITSLDT